MTLALTTARYRIASGTYGSMLIALGSQRPLPQPR
jgi:hypothetical protein